MAIYLEVQLETHRFALGSQILTNCLFSTVVHKYHYSVHLSYKTYRTWLQFVTELFVVCTNRVQLWVRRPVEGTAERTQNGGLSEPVPFVDP